MHLIRIPRSLSLKYQNVWLGVVILNIEVVRIKLVVHKIEVQWDRRMTTLDLWLPAKLHVWHHA